MKVMFACLADYASADQQGGKLNVMGVFDRINTTAFPARHQKMYLVLRLMFEYEDSGRPHTVEFALRDADHKVHLGAQGEIPAAPEVRPGDFTTINQIVELVDLVFTHPGRYHFAVIADGVEVVQIPFDMVLVTGA